MRVIPTNNKKRPFKALWCACMAFLVLGYIIWVFSSAISPQTALASTPYWDQGFLYQDSEGYAHFSFHVLTTWSSRVTRNADIFVNLGSDWGGEYFFGRAGYFNGNISDLFSFFRPEWLAIEQEPGTNVYVEWTAGYTYDVYLKSVNYWVYGQTLEQLKSGNPVNILIHNYLTEGSYAIVSCPDGLYRIYPPNDDPEHYVFTAEPSLTVDYPLDDAEIAESFYITGSFTQPAGGDPSGFLQVDTMPAGTYSSSLQSFWQSIQSATSGAVSIWVSNLPAGYYDFRIYFRGGTFDFYEGAVIYNVHIVNDLSFGLPPTQGLPPFGVVPVYNELVCATYYAENSTYETSTALFSNLCLTLSPVLLGVGGVLTQYSANFTPSNASSTGNQLGQSVVLLRSYLSNLNSFFNGFPVSQFLILYLIALLIAILIRLIKNLIHLAKPV